MAWPEAWREVFDSEPTDRTSREVSVQDVLALLIAGVKPPWFVPHVPTEPGAGFLRALWRAAFGDTPDAAFDWFISEYALPVPSEWRGEIGFTYGCPDFACRSGEHVLIVELKTEEGSYRPRQMSDYLRLARRKHPAEWIDVPCTARRVRGRSRSTTTGNATGRSPGSRRPPSSPPRSRTTGGPFGSAPFCGSTSPSRPTSADGDRRRRRASSLRGGRPSS